MSLVANMLADTDSVDDVGVPPLRLHGIALPNERPPEPQGGS